MNQSDCGELCISFDSYSFFKINNFLIYSFRVNTKLLPIKFDRLKFDGTQLFSAIQSIYGFNFCGANLNHQI